MANDSKSWSQSAGEQEVCKASVHCCQVEGCDADLHADKIYNQRKRLCSAHMAAEAVHKRDQPCQEWRFCFQCGKLEPLELFDGKQRSCRFRLQQRRKPNKGDALDAPAQQQQTQAQPQTQQLPQPQQQPQQRKRQQKRANHSAKRVCGASRRRACAGSQSPDTQHSANEDQQVQQQLPETMPWQQQACSAQQQGALGLQACWANAVGSSAESCVEPLAANAAAAAAAAAACRRQQRLAALAAGAQEAVAQLNSLRRTSTALSAADVAVLLADKEPRMEAAPMRAAPAAAAGGCAARALSSPAALSGHIATLHQQCQELQARLDSMQAGAPTATASVRVAGAAAVPPACSMASGNASAPCMRPAQAPAAAARALKQPVSLQRHGSWESSCPSSPTSAATAVLPAASHMELVEMVVQQLEDSTATAEADELEALLDQELRAAASMPPERARHSWASKLNQMIDSLSTAISGCAMPQASAGPLQQQVLFVPVAAASASAGSVQGAAALPTKHLGGFVPVLNPAAGAAVPAAVVESMVDVRLVSLQQQLAQLQNMVQGLRGQFVV